MPELCWVFIAFNFQPRISLRFSKLGRIFCFETNFHNQTRIKSKYSPLIEVSVQAQFFSVSVWYVIYPYSLVHLIHAQQSSPCQRIVLQFLEPKFCAVQSNDVLNNQFITQSTSMHNKLMFIVTKAKYIPVIKRLRAGPDSIRWGYEITSLHTRPKPHTRAPSAVRLTGWWNGRANAQRREIQPTGATR